MHVSGYITRFWEAIQKRTKHAGLESGATCFSEAPAEGVFSVIENVIKGREDLSLECIESLTRIGMEGPGVATKEGYDLSKRALQMWKGYGERSTTERWIPGMKSKEMINIQEGKRNKLKKRIFIFFGFIHHS